MEMLVAKRDWGRVPKPTDEQGRYRCSKCREWKLPSAFSKNKNQLSGLNYACKPCMKVHTRKYNLPAKYGITAAQFAEKLLAQGGKCACCATPFNMEGRASERACVDHNHSTAEVRDLLCGRCNLAAGNVNDNSLLAEQLAAYLKKWNC
ncbi:MAG: hypothetical protein EBW87_06185 [Burkholderiaceae bacterium]|nr:hypothetical protein [Burkholderiaceae bacterium]